MSSFCFVVFRPQSLLDILESQVMKRMSINHCVEVDAYIHGNVSRVQITSTDISGMDVGPVSLSSTERIRERTSAKLLMSFFVSCVVEFEKAETQAFLALSARLFKSLTAKFEPSSSLNAFSHILISELALSQISFECDCRFRLFYGVGQSLRYIYARSNQRSSLSIRRLQMS